MLVEHLLLVVIAQLTEVAEAVGLSTEERQAEVLAEQVQAVLII
jgi:hypothetical protein